METSNLELILTAASVTGTILVAVLAAFGFLHREMRRGFDRVDKQFAGVAQRFEHINQRFDGIHQRLQRTDQKFDGIHQRLQRTDQRFDGIDQRLQRIDQRFDGIDQGLERIDQRFEGIDQRLQRIDEKFDGRFDELRADITALQVSVARIEGHLGIGVPVSGERLADGEPPERAA